jgi:FMN phosphatase YigB (HAD superfamily)
MTVKTLVFDAYGTLYDVHSVCAKTEELCPGKGDLITQIWRLKQLEYTWLQTSLLEYRDFGFLTRASLEFALRAVAVKSSERTSSRCLANISTLTRTRSQRCAPQVAEPRRLQTGYLVKRQHGHAVGVGEAFRP